MLFASKRFPCFMWAGLGLFIIPLNIDPFYSTYNNYDPAEPYQAVNGELGVGTFKPIKLGGPPHLVIEDEHFFLSQSVQIKPGNAPILYRNCSFTFTGDSNLIIDLNSRDVIFDNVSTSRISGGRTDEGWIYKEYSYSVIKHKEIKNEWRGLYEAKIYK